MSENEITQDAPEAIADFESALDTEGTPEHNASGRIGQACDTATRQSWRIGAAAVAAVGNRPISDRAAATILAERHPVKDEAIRKAMAIHRNTTAAERKLLETWQGAGSVAMLFGKYFSAEGRTKFPGAVDVILAAAGSDDKVTAAAVKDQLAELFPGKPKTPKPPAGGADDDGDGADGADDDGGSKPQFGGTDLDPIEQFTTWLRAQDADTIERARIAVLNVVTQSKSAA